MLVKARYARLNIRTGDGRHRQVRAHRAMLVLYECGEETELFWQVYELFSVAQLEGNPLCINPDHLRWLTKKEHDEVTRQRGHGLTRRWSKYDAEM